MALFERLPDRVHVYEVSPRDGLQNESATVPTHGKARMIDALVGAGIQQLEVTSFVSPKWIPQLADAEEVIQLTQPLERRDQGIHFSALCPNMRGLDRAISTGIGTIAVFVSASESHNKKNVNKTVDETLAVFEQVVPAARKQGLRVRGYVSTVWGCPYEGEIPVRQAIAVASRLMELGCYQVSLGDTIGVGTPVQTLQIINAFLQEFEADTIAMHMHDTRGTALSNVLVGLDRGIRTFDASIGGVGGCPYAPGAAGNLATEDLVYTLEGMGVETGIDLGKLWEAGRVAEALVGHRLPGKVHQAGILSLAQ